MSLGQNNIHLIKCDLKLNNGWALVCVIKAKFIYRNELWSTLEIGLWTQICQNFVTTTGCIEKIWDFFNKTTCIMERPGIPGVAALKNIIVWSSYKFENKAW